MFSVKETAYFQRQVLQVLNATEHEALIDWMADNPLSGDVIPHTGGIRKLRWTRPGMGKRGGARVIYFNQLDDGVVVLLTIYAKAVADNLSPEFLKQLKLISNPL
jgi:hypothetical protein